MAESTNIERICAKHGITEAGQRLLEAIAEPESRTLTVTDICRRADISRTTYYTLFREQAFIQAYLEACKITAIAAAMPTMQTVAGKAIAGDIQAAQMILNMTGLHQPTAQVNINQTIEAGPSLKELLNSRKSD